MVKDASEALRAAEQAVEKLHDALNRAKFEIETQRDKTLVLITGGALTVSFAYVPTLIDKGAVLAQSWLITAWSLWVVTLVLTMANYTLSVRMYSDVLGALSRGDYKHVSDGHWADNWVEKVNVAGIVLMVLGFCAFGTFAIENLERGMYVKERGQAVTGVQEGVSSPRQLAPGAAAGLPAPAAQKARVQEKVTH